MLNKCRTRQRGPLLKLHPQTDGYTNGNSVCGKDSVSNQGKGEVSKHTGLDNWLAGKDKMTREVCLTLPMDNTFPVD